MNRISYPLIRKAEALYNDAIERRNKAEIAKKETGRRKNLTKILVQYFENDLKKKRKEHEQLEFKEIDVLNKCSELESEIQRFVCLNCFL